MARRWLPVALALLLFGLLIEPPPATAHAVLLRISPSPRETLAEAPAQVALLFSEPIDPLFSAVQVLDASRERVDRGDGHVDPTNDHLLAVSLPAGLPNGVYLVLWRSLSTIDVHPDQGQFSLFVGVPVTAGGALETNSAQVTATPETTVGRWWFYLAASCFGGVLAMWKLVMNNVLAGQPDELRAVLRRRVWRLIVLGGVLLISGTLFTAIAQAAAAAHVPLTSAVGQPLADLLLRGRFASIWWPRLGLELASLLLIAVGGLEGLAADCALATLPSVLLTSSLTSHGAALGGGAAQGIVIDWLHIVGATAWVGGLAALVLVVPTLRDSAERGLITRMLASFARFALVASVVVLLSGTLQAALEVGSWSALISSLYGQLVLVKVGLLGAMLVAAVLNEWRRRGTAGAGAAQVGLRRGVRVELALGVVVLAVAAVLSGTPPNGQTPPPPLAVDQSIRP